MDRSSSQQQFGSSERLRTHDHQLRKISSKKYNLSVKLLDIYQSEILIQQDQPTKERKKITQKPPQELEQQLTQDNPMKIRLNLSEINKKSQEKAQRKLNQVLQMQLMQQDYIEQSAQRKLQEKMEQERLKKQMLDDLVKNRQLLKQRIAEPPTVQPKTVKLTSAPKACMVRPAPQETVTPAKKSQEIQISKLRPDSKHLIFDEQPTTENIVIKKKQVQAPPPPPVEVIVSTPEQVSNGSQPSKFISSPVQLTLEELSCQFEATNRWSEKQSVQALNNELLNIIKNGQRYGFCNVPKGFYTQVLQQSIEGSLDLDSLKFEERVNTVLPQNMEMLEIVNNRNEKIKIPIPTKPQGYNWKKLYEINSINKDNSQIPTKEEFYALIPNRFDYSQRAKAIENGQFRTNYQSGYAPVAMQRRETEAESQKKIHFIRQKQSQANLSLKRTCGVSYVKVSESQQLNVEHIFKKLPPLMFQCSSGCQPMEGCDNIYEHLFQQLLNGKYPIICTHLQNEDEETVRDYLLNKGRRMQIAKNRVIIFKELADFWMMSLDQSYIIIHLDYDAQTLLRGFEGDKELQLANFITNSDVAICFQFKKGLTGRKAFLKSVGLFYLHEKSNGENNETAQVEEKEFNPLLDTPKRPLKSAPSQQLVDLLKKEEGHANIYSFSIRMEMVVNEHSWHSAQKGVKNLLAGFIQYTESKIQSGYLVRMMNKRLKALSKGVAYLQDKFQKKIRVLDLPIIPSDSLQKYDFGRWENEFKQETLQALLLMKSRYLYLDALKASLESRSRPLTLDQIRKGGKEIGYLEHPLYCISTRDSFAYDLIEKTEFVILDGRRVKKTEYFFDPANCPSNYAPTFLNLFPDYRVGVVSYEDYFTHEEMNEIERNIFETEVKAFNGVFMPQTAQIQIGSTVGHVPSVRRTKFFFGYRYMWTRCQLAEPNSNVAAGVRRDVSETPDWMKQLVVNKLESSGIIPKNFINSIACNVYHDGKEGLAQHFDDAVRFRQPIFTLRAFSDCRLCFGSQYYGFCNGAFAVPLPRGCILVMEEESYAGNGVKHCVRPCDMTGKSAAIILRQMHHQVTSEAEKYDELIDFPGQMSTLSLNEDAVPYSEQKRLEAEMLLAQK